MRTMLKIAAAVLLPLGLFACDANSTSPSDRTQQRAEAEPAGEQEQTADREQGAAQKESDEATGSSDESTADPATATLSVEEMVCEGCASAVKSNLTEVSGVSEVSTSFEKDRAEVTYDPQEVEPERFVEALSDVEMSGTKMDWKVEIVDRPANDKSQ